MFGRRTHLRFTVTVPPEGILAVSRDGLLQAPVGNAMIALSPEPGVVGETVRVDVIDAEQTVNARMQVVESRPALVDGTLWHRLRLEPVQ